VGGLGWWRGWGGLGDLPRRAVCLVWGGFCFFVLLFVPETSAEIGGGWGMGGLVGGVTDCDPVWRAFATEGWRVGGLR